MYRICPPNPLTQQSEQVLRLTDYSFIPFDPANADYHAYLEWVAEGNTPEPYEIPESEPPLA
jgi:hypothetical protein